MSAGYIPLPVNKAVGIGDKEQERTLNLSRSFGASSYDKMPRSFLPPIFFLSTSSTGGRYSLFDLFAQPIIQAGSGKIVFASNRDGQTQIYLMNADGSGQVKLPGGNGNDDLPRWSPDGTAILFQSDRDNVDTSNNDIYLMDAGGNRQTRLTTDPNDDSSASWSPDGSRIAFQSLRNGTFYQIYSMNADGTSQFNLSNSGSNDRQPSWSPDGSKIAFASERDHAGFACIYVMRADGSQQTRLTWSDAPFQDEQPVWSPDGTKLAFTSTRDSVVENWQETEEEGGVVQRSAVRTNREVYVMNADGSNQIRLTGRLENDDSPAWSPDGTQIIFRSDREQDCCDPAAHVWVMNADGTSQSNLSGNQFGDYSASWSRGGSPIPTDEAAADQANQVTINFNNLPGNSIVTNQYLPNVTFSGNSFSGGSNPPFGSDVITRLLSPYAPPQIGIISRNTYQAQWDGDGANASLFVDFKAPVNNLSFYVLNTFGSNLSFAEIQYWVNWQYAGSWYLRGTGGYWNPGPPILVNFASVPQITGLRIIPSGNQDIAGHNYPFIYDDFTFTPDLNINITNSRIAENLQGSTRYALLGGDVTFQTNVNRPGGTYSWSVSGTDYQRISSSTTQSSLIGRWTEPGTYTVTVNYTLNNITTSSSVTVNVVEPTLRAYSAVQRSEQVRSGAGCDLMPGQTYTLGCPPNEPYGITFTATVDVPNLPYLSDPAQSGIKNVQAVSAMRKWEQRGNFYCLTKRSSEANIASGWQRDASSNFTFIPFVKFNAGNSVTLETNDAPGTSPLGDVYYANDYFERYVYYFTGSDPATSVFERPLKLQGTSNIARIAWHWGGQVVFIFNPDPDGLKYRITSSTTPTGPITATGAPAVAPMNTKVTDLTAQICPGTSETNNLLDDSAMFVEQHYLDFFGREPDETGWNYWRSNISQCAFDTTCIYNKRIDVSRAFFYSTEFVGLHPELGGQRGSHAYNYSFVYWCYRTYLQREPNAPPDNNWDGFNFWVDVLDQTNPDASDGKYNRIIDAFINSTEYRNRGIP